MAQPTRMLAVAAMALAACGGATKGPPSPAPVTTKASTTSVAAPAPAPPLTAEQVEQQAALLEAGEAAMYRALDPAAALRAYEALRALIPQRAETYQTLAILYADQRRFDDALAAADQFVKLAAKPAVALDARAEIYLLLGDLDRAAEEFKAAIAAEPSFRNAWLGLATTQAHRGSWGAAAAELTRGLAVMRGDEDKAALKEALGWAQLWGGYPDAGAATLRKLHAHDLNRKDLLETQLAIELERWRDAKPLSLRAFQIGSGKHFEGLPDNRQATLDAAAARVRRDPELRWCYVLLAIASAQSDDLPQLNRAAVTLRVITMHQQLDPWITKDITLSAGLESLVRGDYPRALAAFADPWVRNHLSLYDPSRAFAHPSHEHLALTAQLFTAEALFRAGRVTEANDLLDQLELTYHRGLGAVRVREQARALRLRHLPKGTGVTPI